MKTTGTRVALSNGRKLVDDVIRIANRQPMAAFTRDLDLSPLAELRRQIRPRVSWNAIMMKAYAMVAKENPLLRQTYIGFPWPHIYQSSSNVAMITIAREEGDGERLYFARIHRPEELSLGRIQEKLDYFNNEPVSQIKQFRHQNNFASLPRFARRMLWWLMLDLWPSKRAGHVGTFGMSISGFNYAYGNCHLGPNTTILGVDPSPRQGVCRTMLTFDHRILDGKPTIDAITQLSVTLHGPILSELQAMREHAQSGQSQPAAMPAVNRAA